AAHFGFPRKLWAELLDEGRVTRHPIDKPGWAARAITSDLSPRPAATGSHVSIDSHGKGADRRRPAPAERRALPPARATGTTSQPVSVAPARLAPVERRLVSDAVHERLLDTVLGAAPGDALPSERALSQAFGVNRHAVREA